MSRTEGRSALDEVTQELRRDFVRVARADAKDPPRTERRRRFALALTAAAVLIPAGFAFGLQGEDEGGGFDPPEFDVSQAPRDRVGAAVEGVPGLSDGAPGVNLMPGQLSDETWIVDSARPADALVEACRGQSPAPGCGLILALADGKLDPGIYSEAELRQAVEDAGYEWRQN